MTLRIEVSRKLFLLEDKKLKMSEEITDSSRSCWPLRTTKCLPLYSRKDLMVAIFLPPFLLSHLSSLLAASTFRQEKTPQAELLNAFISNTLTNL
jgi:hypothetical protein